MSICILSNRARILLPCPRFQRTFCITCGPLMPFHSISTCAAYSATAHRKSREKLRDRRSEEQHEPDAHRLFRRSIFADIQLALPAHARMRTCGRQSRLQEDNDGLAVLGNDRVLFDGAPKTQRQHLSFLLGFGNCGVGRQPSFCSTSAQS